ncbi:MAG: hypothetical protein KC435_00410 [Thermomicrobiales bacterium]|nr:hypothetical protein [Thermomicrobiales bacterium]
MSTMFYAGVDGGGTKTAIVVVDDTGNEVARATTTTSNSAVIGHANAAGVLCDLVEKTCGTAGIAMPLAGLWCGLSGSDRPEDQAQLQPRLEHLTRDLRLTNDAELAMGALPGEVGIVLVSGTGSIAFGRNPEGKRHRASGWGHIFGDYGSGYDIARKALYQYSAYIDGYGPWTSLVDRFTELYELTDPYSIINRIYDVKTTKGDIARLSRVVVAEANHGDAVSIQIINDVADDLAVYADAVARKLSLGLALNLAMVGGMLTHVPMFEQRVLARLKENWEIGAVQHVTDPALTGARAIASKESKV